MSTEKSSGNSRTPEAPSLASKLNRLFELAGGNERRPPSNRTVAEAISAQGTPISEATIHYLRTGARDNPNKRHLEGLARYFEVPVAFLHDDEGASARIYEELELISAMRDAEVRVLAMRGAQMTPRMRRWLVDMLTSLENAQSGSTSAEAEDEDEDGGTAQRS